jgi:hypothetical protein
MLWKSNSLNMLMYILFKYMFNYNLLKKEEDKILLARMCYTQKFKSHGYWFFSMSTSAYM